MSPTCAAILILGTHSPLHAAAISIISSTVSVQGSAGGNSYSGLNSGTATGTTGDGSTWRSSSSGSITTTGATLNAQSLYQSGPANDWWSAGYSSVTLTSVFQPLSPNIIFNFSGSVGFHAFESYITFTLKDITPPVPVAVRSTNWAFESDWVAEDLPYTANLALDVGHQYELVLFAKGTIGDSRRGFANLELQIVPEPSSAALLIIGAAGLICRRNRKPV